mgnify:CR=1 FL=1
MILERKILKKVVKDLKSKGKKIVFTNGCFDILHPGHIFYLNEAKKLGDYLVVALNTDNSVKRLKGENRPVNTQEDRAVVMDALETVDIVTFFHEDTPLEIVSELIPDVIVKGGDYKPEDVAGGEVVTKNGGEIRIINFVDGKSTTSVIERMKLK